jgi:hypothetical protein
MNYGIEHGVVREPVQVVRHLPENWAKILLLRTHGLGLAQGEAFWKIPTEVLPAHRWAVGSRFVLVVNELGLRGAALRGREAWKDAVEIEELSKGEEALWPESKSPLW